MKTPFPMFLKDCHLSPIATGNAAESLIEFRDELQIIPTSSLYHHFWGGKLRLSFAPPEFHNDFAHWAHFGLHDDILMERLSIIDPIDYPNLEGLRRQVLDTIEGRIKEEKSIIWSRKETKFYFLRSIIIVSDLGIIANAPSDLRGILPKLTLTSLFYHFIDARRRTPNRSDDFTVWLASFGSQYSKLIKSIQRIDPYFLTLSEIRQKIIESVNEHL